MTREEFSRHVVTNYDTLLRFVRGRGLSAPDAEDVLQQSLLKLLPVCAGIDAARPDGFFFATLRHAVVDFWRKRGRQPPAVPLPEQLPAPDLPDAIVPADDEAACCHDVLAAAVAGLTPRERRAFTAYWRHRGDRPAALAALARAGGTPYSVYDGPLHHARRKLALALQPHHAVLFEAGYSRLWGLLNEVL